MPNHNVLAWTVTTAGKVEVGQYISGLRSTTPRKVVRIEKSDLIVTIYEEGCTHPYLTVNPNHPLDLLINYLTKEPVTEL